MQWQATDQFGNLYVGESEAKTFDELKPDLASLVEELLARTPDPVRISVDLDYCEVNGPDPNQVSHVLRVPALASFHTDESPAAILESFSAAIRDLGQDSGRITVELA